jgi:hypothetical protein
MDQYLLDTEIPWRRLHGRFPLVARSKTVKRICKEPKGVLGAFVRTRCDSAVLFPKRLHADALISSDTGLRGVEKKASGIIKAFR